MMADVQIGQKAIRPIFIVLLLLLLSFIFLLPMANGLTDDEDFLSVRAEVTGFSQGVQGSGFITIRVEDLLDYNRAEGTNYSMVRQGTSLTLGFLWGHTPVNGSYIPPSIGSKIIANISQHDKFTSHSGHLYSYTLLCGDEEILIEGVCAPKACAYDERREGSLCVKLECKQNQGYKNHSCYDLNCDSSEEIVDHQCIGIVCADDEFAMDHVCQKLSCGINKVARSHECVPLICGVFTKAGNNTCMVDWLQITVFSAAMFLLLFMIYHLLIKDLFGDVKKGERGILKNLGLILVFITALVVLILPSVSRLIFHSNLLPGSESYLNQQVSARLMDGSLRFSFLGGTSIYHLLVAYLGKIFGIDLVARMLPIIFGAFSASIFYLILKKIINDVRTSALAAMVLIFSPAFIYLFSISSPHSLIAFLLLFGTYLLLSSRKQYVLSGGLILLMISLSNPFVFALSLSASLLIILQTRNSGRLRKTLFILTMLAGLTSVFFLYDYTRPATSFRLDILRQSVTDFGGTIGFGIFHIILFISGLLSTWKRKSSYIPLYILLALVFALMLALDTNYNAYLNFVVIYFIGVALSNLADMKWESAQLKNIALLIIFCGLLFSGVSYAKRIALMEPEPMLAEGLSKLSSYPKGIVLSDLGYTEAIEYFSGMPAYLSSEGDDAGRRLNLSKEVFYSRRLDRTRQILDEEKIRYIIVDKEMRRGLVWEREDQGLLFLFQNNETFRKLYGREVGVEVWEYLPQAREQ